MGTGHSDVSGNCKAVELAQFLTINNNLIGEMLNFIWEASDISMLIILKIYKNWLTETVAVRNSSFSSPDGSSE